MRWSRPISTELADGLVEHDLGSGYEPTGFIRQMVMFTRAHHLALFSTSAAASYAKEQIPVNSTPPTTTMSKPTAGQRFARAGAFLFAGASDPFGVTKVEFELRVGQSGSKVISPGFKASFTWLGGWNTESVPNGAVLSSQRCLRSRWSSLNQSMGSRGSEQLILVGPLKDARRPLPEQMPSKDTFHDPAKSEMMARLRNGPGGTGRRFNLVSRMPHEQRSFSLS